MGREVLDNNEGCRPVDSASAIFDLYAKSVIEVFYGHGVVAVIPDGVEPIGDGFAAVPSPFGGDGGWVITAWNPRSAGGLSLEQNRGRNAELRRFLVEEGAEMLDAVGRSRSGDVAEESFYCTGLDQGVVLALGERFEQNAVFHLDAIRLSVVGVLIDDRRTIGYSVWTRANRSPPKTG